MPRDRRRVVLAVRSDSFAGVERYLCDVANELAGRGWQVAVIGGNQQSMGDRLHERVRFTPAATTLGVAKVLLRHAGADVIHVHMTAAEAAAVMALPFTRRRFVTTRHFAGRRGSSLASRAFAPVLRAAGKQQISISRFVAESVGEPSVVIHNGVQMEPAAELTSPTVTMLQRLEPEKDPMTGLRAWAASGLGEQGWRLTLAGRGKLEADLRRAVDALSIAGSVDLLGFVDDTRELLEGTSILLAPARGEPFGLSVVEAMARGIPVVASAAGAHLETVARDDLLFQPGDHVACAAVLRRLVEDVHERRSIGAALRARQRAQFSVSVHVDRLEEVYRFSLARRRSVA